MRPLSHAYWRLRNRPRRNCFYKKTERFSGSLPIFLVSAALWVWFLGWVFFFYPPRLISEFLQQSPAEPAPSPGERPRQRRCPQESPLPAANPGTSRGKRPGPAPRLRAGPRTPPTPSVPVVPPPGTRGLPGGSIPAVPHPVFPRSPSAEQARFTHSTFSWSAPPQLQASTCCWISPWWPPAEPSAPAKSAQRRLRPPPPRPHCGGMEGHGDGTHTHTGRGRGCLGGSSRPGYIPRRGAGSKAGSGGGWRGRGVVVVVGGGVLCCRGLAAKEGERRCRAALRVSVCVRVLCVCVCACPWLLAPSPPSAERPRSAAGARRGGAPRPALRDGGGKKGGGGGGSGLAPAAPNCVWGGAQTGLLPWGLPLPAFPEPLRQGLEGKRWRKMSRGGVKGGCSAGVLPSGSVAGGRGPARRAGG